MSLNRTSQLAIRLRPLGERDLIQAAARDARMWESEWARAVLLKAARKRLGRAETPSPEAEES